MERGVRTACGAVCVGFDVAGSPVTIEHELRWEDPPAVDPRAAKGRSQVDRNIDRLRARPGKWAIVAEYQVNTTATGVADKYKRSGCEATTRGGLVYARWPRPVANDDPRTWGNCISRSDLPPVTGNCEWHDSGPEQNRCPRVALQWKYLPSGGWYPLCFEHVDYLTQLDREWDDAEDTEFDR